jgi:alcohol dehydrogenase class IV
MAHGGKPRDYFGDDCLSGPVLPLVCVPTTAGTGSEVSASCVLTDREAQVKVGVLSNYLRPRLAIVDPLLTLSCPAKVTADSGIDALTHAIEAYVSRRANPFSDGMALAAMRAIWPAIRTAYGEPGNPDARAAMMLGAHQAGIAFSNASVALVHGMSRPIGAHFHVAHGLSNAMLLPTITRWSASGALPRYATCARTMGIVPEGTDDDTAVARLAQALATLNRDLAVPTPKSYGIAPDQWTRLIPLMAEQALASGSPANNPRIPDAAMIEALYREVWD